MTNHKFDAFSFHPVMDEVIKGLGFVEPTPIQQQVIPAVSRGESIVGQSHTGSGKTHSYLLPLFNRLDESTKQVQFIVTAPTRELAIQIYEEVRKIIQHADKDQVWRAKLLIGGTDKQKSIEKLKEPPHIIVGTPGRILDLVEEDALSIHSSTAFVIDEADLMIDLGFMNEVDQLLVRSNQKVQVLVFSATIHEKLKPFLKKYLQNPTYIHAQEKHPSPEAIEHRLISLRHKEPADVIMQVSKLINPYLALIFVNRKENANELAKTLTMKGLEVGLLHGGLTPRERKRMLKDIKTLRYQYIVATDLAARGIDIQGVSHVINSELPKEEEFYIHRVGRTARAGLEGTAISLYTDDDEQLIGKLENSGLTFNSYDISKGEWEPSKDRNERSLRKKRESNEEKQVWSRVRKPKKVKPGYKKKMKKEAEHIKKRMNKNHKRK